LVEGDGSQLPPFDAGPDVVNRRIDLAHCVDAYTRGSGEPDPWGWMERMQRRLQGEELDSFSTQDVLDVLFLSCRNDRATGSHFVEQGWFLRAANEVRRRAIEARRPDLSQEQLLKLPVFIPYRAKKDPRDLKVLDPACGSGHFLLYCFDLLVTIYEEAW